MPSPACWPDKKGSRVLEHDKSRPLETPMNQGSSVRPAADVAPLGAQTLPTLLDVDDDEAGLPSGTQYDFYGRPLDGPLYPQCPREPRCKIYRVGTETLIGERHEHGIRVIRYLDP